MLESGKQLVGFLISQTTESKYYDLWPVMEKNALIC